MNMTRSTPCLDPEDLAAFIDRRLPAAERRRVEEHLVDCPDCYEVFVSTVRFLEEEEEDGRTERDRGRIRHGPWPGRAGLRVILPLAATLVVAVGLWTAVRHGWLGGTGRFPASDEMVAGLDSAVLPTGRLDELVRDQGWPRTRGISSPSDSFRVDDLGGAAAFAPDTAFQLGALHTDLELALRRPDLDRGLPIQLIGRIERLLESSPSGELQSSSYAALKNRLAKGDEPIARVREDATALAEQVQRLVGEAPYRLGAWAEAGRLAAAAGSVEQLRRGGVQGAGKRLDRTALPPALDAAVGRALDAADRGASADDLARAEAAFSELVALGGHRWSEVGSDPALRDGHVRSVPRDEPGDQG